MAPVAKSDEKVEFKKGDFVVYPAHGVGEIEAVEVQIIGGMEIKLYAISFEKDRMRLKVPVFKAHASGLRRLSSQNQMQDAIKTLQGARKSATMWSRRAQEYETKINSVTPSPSPKFCATSSVATTTRNNLTPSARYTNQLWSDLPVKWPPLSVLPKSRQQPALKI